QRRNPHRNHNQITSHPQKVQDANPKLSMFVRYIAKCPYPQGFERSMVHVTHALPEEDGRTLSVAAQYLVNDGKIVAGRLDGKGPVIQGDLADKQWQNEQQNATGRGRG